VAAALLCFLAAGRGVAADLDATTRVALKQSARAAMSRPRSPWMDRGTLLKRPLISGVRMSPDGRFVSFLKRSGQGADLWIQDVAEGSRARLLADVRGADQRWSGDGSRLWLADEQGLAVVEPVSRRARRILKWDGSRRQRLFGLDPRAPSHAMVAEQVEVNGTLVHRYLLADDAGTTRLLHEAAQPLRKALLRSDGSLAFTAAYDGPGYDTVIRRHTVEGVLEIARCRGIEVCEPVGYGGPGDALWVLAHRGEDRIALQRWQAVSPHWTTVHRDPAGIADAADVIWNGPLGGWQAIAYDGTRRRWHGNGAGVKGILASLEQRLPDANLGLASSVDGRVWLVRAERSSWPRARHFLYEPARARLQPLFAREDAGAGAPSSDHMAAAEPAAWRAGDGMLLHGYVHLPGGVALDKAPLIAWLHGGPFARLHDAYDPRIQLLVNRGYIVFVPNFRGSTGYGLRYQRAANGDVGNGRVLQDVLDGLDALLAAGIGDRGLQALAGHSFGGYASLLAVTHRPDRFRFAYAGAAPTDYGWQKRWQAAHESASLRGEGPPVALSFTQHGLPFTDPAWRARMERESPLASVSRVRTPVYLWAGARDDRTPIKSIAHYAGEAKRHGRAITLLIDPDAGHTPVHDLGDEAWVFLLESAAHRHFGGGVTPASPELAAFLRRNVPFDTEDVVSGRPAAASRPAAP
jgi:dipeptidyl aminopeptidase/acylaminoacyl peptidase